MKKTICMMAIASLALFSCDEQKNDDIVKEPNRDGSIETTLDVEHQKGYDLLTTTYKVWVNKQLDKTIVRTDTLKFLGTTVQDAEDKDGNTKKVTVPKDYEFYITVK